jgi:hypothetical protein
MSTRILSPRDALCHIYILIMRYYRVGGTPGGYFTCGWLKLVADSADSQLGCRHSPVTWQASELPSFEICRLEKLTDSLDQSCWIDLGDFGYLRVLIASREKRVPVIDPLSYDFEFPQRTQIAEIDNADSVDKIMNIIRWDHEEFPLRADHPFPFNQKIRKPTQASSPIWAVMACLPWLSFGRALPGSNERLLNSLAIHSWLIVLFW